MVVHLDETDVGAVPRWDNLVVAMARALAAFSSGQLLQPVRNIHTIEEGRRDLATCQSAAWKLTELHS